MGSESSLGAAFRTECEFLWLRYLSVLLKAGVTFPRLILQKPGFPAFQIILKAVGLK